jgi:hypothetical protein
MRQDARVPPSLAATIGKLQKAEDAYQLARAEVSPTAEAITRAVGAVLRRAK